MRTWLAALAVVGCAPSTVDADALPPGNVLLVVLDDVGAYDVHAYGFAADAPRTPALDRLAAQGVRFTRAWGNPLCSPSRASIQTGLYPLHAGVGDNLPRRGDGFALPVDTPNLPTWLRDQAGYTTAAVGKWHLSTDRDPQGATPLGYGYDRYVGQPTNLLDVESEGEVVSTSYYRWREWRGGYRWRKGYLTHTEVDDAVAIVADLPSPWFLQVAVHAVHLPLDLPPDTPAPDGGWTGRRKYVAMLEDLDAQLARLLDAVPVDTTVIVVGDNGAPNNLDTPDFDGADTKGSVMEGGVRVPLIVRSPWVTHPGVAVDALVHLVDLLPTIADVAHAPVGDSLALDGRSLVPFLIDPHAADPRSVVYSERFQPSGDPARATLREQAIRDTRYKLTRTNGVDACFDLGQDLHEGADLLTRDGASDAALGACAALAARLDAHDLR
jgi:arylsulfatase A-like enzyme